MNVDIKRAWMSEELMTYALKHLLKIINTI